MDIIVGSLEQGFVFGIMVLGVYISYKILDFPDLSVDGTFPLGASVVAICLQKGWSPFIGLFLAIIAGALAGGFTGFIHVKFKIRDLLAGILTMTALYSINLRIMGKSNMHLFNVDHHMFKWDVNKLLLIVIIAILSKFLLDYLLSTKFGFALRALGDNEKLVVALGINEKRLKIIGLMLSNALVAFAGGVYAQYQGFSDVGMGIGIIVAGLASIIIGEGILQAVKGGKLLKMTTVVLIGSIIYRQAIASALKAGLPASDLKLITALIVIIILAPKKGIYKKLWDAFLRRGLGVFYNGRN